MNDTNYKNYRTEQTLMDCGFNPDSIESIRSTGVVTHNGQQHVIHKSQKHLFDKQDCKVKEDSINENNFKLAQELIQQQKVFSRFKQYSDTRIMKLESQMSHVLEQLKTATEIIKTLKSNNQAASNRAKIQESKEGKEPSVESIDRNKVAPADVCIEKMFYYGNT